MIGQGQCFCIRELSHELFPCFGLGLWLAVGIFGKLCGTWQVFNPSLCCVGADNKAFFVISMSATGAHIYELVAQTVSEKNV